MGYSHYWTINNQPSDANWADVIEGVDAILKETSILIQNDSEGNVICINGLAPDDFETFRIDPSDLGWNFCKTGNKPYDTVVVAILCLIGVICGGAFEITSGGDVGDWAEGQKLVSLAADEPVQIPSTI